MSYLTDPFGVPRPSGHHPTASESYESDAHGPDAHGPDAGETDAHEPDAGETDAETGAAEDRPSSGTAAWAGDENGWVAATAEDTAPEDAAAEDAAAEDMDDGPDDSAQIIPLKAPRDGVPDVVDSERTLLEAARALSAGSGPLAVDAERASGYRYGQRAYLVQLRREGAGTWLIDPVGCPDLSPIAQVTADVEWILHAATQDLPCLREVGLAPSSLFDTELGARLAGLPRVGLAAVIEHYAGYALAKEHSAVDWSTRPLPEPWLRYAALDVELLTEVREAMSEDLSEQGKLEWALEEFAALTHFAGPPIRTDPWRRTSGMHKMRSRRTLAVVRELWYARDDIARMRDISPGRILPDAALLSLAQAAPRSAAQIAGVNSHKSVRRHQSEWLAAVERAANLAEDELPVSALPADGPPPQRAWADRDPIAAARLNQARTEMTQFAEQHRVPLENLLTPDLLRRVLWTPPGPDEPAIDAALEAGGARRWQRTVTAPIIARACRDHP